MRSVCCGPLVLLAPVIAIAVSLGCGGDKRRSKPTPPTWTPEARAKAISDGAAVIEKHECTRCHTVDKLITAGGKQNRRARDCVSCHVFLKGLKPEQKLYQRIAANNGKDVLDRYIANIEHLLRVPDLTGIAKRIRPDWIAGYLHAPFDLRPVMSESMYRNQLSKEEAKTIARYLAAVADVPDPFGAGAPKHTPPPRPDAERLAAGKKAFKKWGCQTCHTFGNVDFGTSKKTLVATKQISLLAPNLRFAKDRMDSATMVKWIMNPQSVQPTATMLNFGVDKEGAELIRDYLFYGDPELRPAPSAEARAELMKLPPAATHQVDWKEVKDKVLGVVCVHCHMNDYEKDTGPGNKGGMGYPGLGLSFRTYRRTVWGAVDKKTGERYSVLVPREGEKLPRLLQVLLVRRLENLRDRHEPFADHQLPEFPSGLLGMPMGFDALTNEQIGIVRAWIEQGCRGQSDITGKPGFDDGFLVADGPIEKNQGCELREPKTPPPAWSVEAYRAKHGDKGKASAKKANQKKPNPKKAKGDPKK